MNATIVVTLLQTILSLVPQLTSSKGVNNVITALLQIIPIAVKEAQELLPMVQNIIAALKSTSAPTAEQLAALDALDEQVDAAFEAAVNAWVANHPQEVK